jgi:hypothetical protein
MTWPSPADEAEAEVVAVVLVREVRKHRETCQDCAQAGSAVYCHRVDRAIREAIEWAKLRAVLTRAEDLRAFQNELYKEVVG